MLHCVFRLQSDVQEIDAHLRIRRKTRLKVFFKTLEDSHADENKLRCSDVASRGASALGVALLAAHFSDQQPNKKGFLPGKYLKIPHRERILVDFSRLPRTQSILAARRRCCAAIYNLVNVLFPVVHHGFEIAS